MKVPLVDLAAQSADVAEEVRQGFDQVMRTGGFIGGPLVSAFEQQYAAYVGSRYCVGVANGTDAMELALRAVGVGRNDEVVLPANTFIATAEAVSRIGAVPVLADVDANHLLLDPEQVARVLTSRTRAVVPVHLFGQTAPTDQLVHLARSRGAVVLEDAAQSQGASRFGKPAGTFGVAAGTSFYPGKNLGAAGDAGAVLTDDPDIAQQVRVLGAHGSAAKYVHDVVGFNSRLDALQAVVLSAKLAHLERWNEARRALAARYSELLAGIDDVSVPQSMDGNIDVWHLYVVQVPDRDRVLARLNEMGVGAGIHYPTPVHLTGAYRHLGYSAGSFPVAETAAERILSLPIYPHLTTDQQDYVVECLEKALVG